MSLIYKVCAIYHHTQVDMPYTSIFDGPTIITKETLCKILNLNTTRPGLNFTQDEIKKAYKERALRFHPDKQQGIDKPIPTRICNVLMNDINLAKNYMLKGEENIPGKEFMSTSQPLDSMNVFEAILSALNAIKNGTSTLSSTVGWLSFFSSNYLTIMLLSTYSDDQLNFRFINQFSDGLTALRPFLKEINGSSLASFLHFLQKKLDTPDELNSEDIAQQLKEILPETILTDEQISALITTIKETGDSLKNMLSDDFINDVEHIFKFWPDFLSTLPTWKHITGVYFFSLFFTATNIPKFFNAIKVISEVIIQQKGLIHFLLTALPLTLLTVVVLPLNIALHLSVQLSWIALKASFQLLYNGIKIVSSTINALLSLLPGSEKSFYPSFFPLLEASFNLFIRLAINVLIESLDTVVFIASNNTLPESLYENVNSTFDTLLDSIRPESDINIEAQQERRLIVIEEQSPPQQQNTLPLDVPAEQNLGFFSTGPLHNPEDTWLDQILANCIEDNPDVNATAGHERMAI